MGKSIRDAKIRTPRMVTDRHVVTRVVVERQEDDPLLGTLAQVDVVAEGRTDIRIGGD
jgi:hypothetical protein